jgi:hypothetical protein
MSASAWVRFWAVTTTSPSTAFSAGAACCAEAAAAARIIAIAVGIVSVARAD